MAVFRVGEFATYYKFTSASDVLFLPIIFTSFINGQQLIIVMMISANMFVVCNPILPGLMSTFLLSHATVSYQCWRFVSKPLRVVLMYIWAITTDLYSINIATSLM